MQEFPQSPQTFPKIFLNITLIWLFQYFVGYSLYPLDLGCRYIWLIWLCCSTSEVFTKQFRQFNFSAAKAANKTESEKAPGFRSTQQFCRIYSAIYIIRIFSTQHWELSKQRTQYTVLRDESVDISLLNHGKKNTELGAAE